MRDHACDRAGGYKQGSPHEQPAADTDYLGLAIAVATYGLHRPHIAVFRIDTKAGSDPPVDNSTFGAVSDAHRGNASNVLTSSRIAFSAGARIGEDADSHSSAWERLDHNRACLSAPRKLWRRAHHILRELGDNALATPGTGDTHARRRLSAHAEHLTTKRPTQISSNTGPVGHRSAGDRIPKDGGTLTTAAIGVEWIRRGRDVCLSAW